MPSFKSRSRSILIVIIVCLPAIPFSLRLDHGSVTPPALSINGSAGNFAGKVLLGVPEPSLDGATGSDPNDTVERVGYIGADGIFITMDTWWNHIDLFKDALRRYKKAGLLIAGMWEQHCNYLDYCYSYNPPIHDWALANQDKQMVSFWRLLINGSANSAGIYEQGDSYQGNLSGTQNPDGSVDIKIRNLDYYEPAYLSGRYDEPSVYEEYPASEFSWLYDENGVGYDVKETPKENGARIPYGTGYKLFVKDNAQYVTLYNLGNRILNLYVLFYIPSFPSVYFAESRNVWLGTLRNFLSNFSEYLDAFMQNSGGFPIPLGDFHPDILRSIEVKYGVDFNFDDWQFRIRADYDFDEKTQVQYLFDRESYFIFKEYAREKQDLLHENGVIFVPTSSDTMYMLWAMIEHVDSLLVTNILDSCSVDRYGFSFATGEWPPSTVRLGIWNSYLMWPDSTGDEIRNWGSYTVDCALKWNPDGATMTYWLGTNWDVNSEQVTAMRDVTQYTHARFRHVLMIPADVKRYTVANVYQISYQNRYGVETDLNPGQIDIYPIYVKDLRWDPLPTDGCLLLSQSGIVMGSSPSYDIAEHMKIVQAVEDGASLAFSGATLRQVGDYYQNPGIEELLYNASQVETWTNDRAPGLAAHYLTFDGTLDPRILNGSSHGNHWMTLKSYAIADVIIGQFPTTGLYETERGKGRIIGFSDGSDPFKTDFTDAISATYGDEFFVRFFEYCAGNEGIFRLWDVGKTYLYEANPSTYYALLVERYGLSRDVPIIAYGANDVTITDLDTNQQISNNSAIHLDANSTKLLMIRLGSAPNIVRWSVDLTVGKHLMSIPLLLEDYRVESVLASITGKYAYVRAYDARDVLSPWKSFVQGRQVNSLQNISPDMGFWIEITSPCRLSMTGRPPTATFIQLVGGAWNLVGYPSLNMMYKVADLKAELSGAVVEGFDVNTTSYNTVRLPDSHTLKAGEGYWIYVPSNASWSVAGWG